MDENASKIYFSDVCECFFEENVKNELVLSGRGFLSVLLSGYR